MFTHFTKVVSILIASLGLSTSAFSNEVELYQCQSSAYHLELNSTLARQAVEWKSKKTITPPSSPKEALNRANEVTRQGNPMSADGSLDRKKLKKWYESNFCQKTIAEYQEQLYGPVAADELLFMKENSSSDKAQLRQTYFYSRSFADASEKDTSCAKFKEQHNAIYNSDLQDAGHRALMESGLRKTLTSSTKNLKNYQIELLEDYASESKIKSFAQEIYAYCMGGRQENNNLSEQLIRHPGMTYSKRTKTINIKSNSMTNNRECGAAPKIYCEADLIRSALAASYTRSHECDLGKISGAQCQDDAETMYKKVLIEVEINTLTTEKTMREKYIADPVGSRLFNSPNASRNMDNLSEPCKQQAIQAGLRGAAFQEYATNVCIPQAKQVFIKPQVEELNRINARLKELMRAQS